MKKTGKEKRKKVEREGRRKATACFSFSESFSKG